MKAVIFDFDGVIVNTYNLCYGIRKSMEPTLDHVTYQKYLDGTVKELYSNPEGKTVSEMRLAFFTPYEAKLHAEQHHTEEMGELIRSLQSAYTLHIVTSAPEATVERYLRENNLRDCFTSILGIDTAFNKVDKFKMVFQEYDLEPANVVFITDTLGDIIEANQVQLLTIGVSWGFQNQERLEKGSPAAVVHSVQELAALLSRLQ